MADVMLRERDVPLFDRACVPETVILAADRRHLRLIWCEGEAMTLDAADLRRACRCAWCTRARLEGTFAGQFEGAALQSITPVGDYALNIAFMDGHARGVFPWTYLRTIGASGAAAQGSDTAAHSDGSPE